MLIGRDCSLTHEPTQAGLEPVALGLAGEEVTPPLSTLYLYDILKK
jgi:hypothetical protein